MRQRNVEEILEALWLSDESGWEPEVQEVLDRAHGDADTVDLGDAISAGLVRQDGELIRLTDAGKSAARLIVRRHRLAERLLCDVLQICGPFMESSACEFEHFLSPEGTDSICTLLQMAMDQYLQARNALIQKDLIDFDGTIFQVLDLPLVALTSNSSTKSKSLQFKQLLQSTLKEVPA